MARNYDGYITAAFTAGIPTELMQTVRGWIEKHHSLLGDLEPVTATSDLGYSELSDIQTLEQAFDSIKECITMATLHETEAKTERAKKKFYKDAGGRVGKGVYRYALKGYYLFQ